MRDMSSLEELMKPRQNYELKEVPNDWIAKEPDYVGIGVGRSGTTWWNGLIMQHPETVYNRKGKKEVHFFEHFSYKGLSDKDKSLYREIFRTPLNKITGEWSPNYFTFPFSIQYLHEAAPNTKILLMVRNPVDRFFSHLNMSIGVNQNSLSLSDQSRYMHEHFMIFPRVLFNSLLNFHLERLIKFFPMKQILLLQYEKCIVDTYSEIRKTYSFLGLDPEFVPKDVDKIVNKHVKVEHDLLDESSRGNIRDFLLEDVCRFAEKFPEIDLSLWRDFAN